MPQPPVPPSEATASELAEPDILDTTEAGPRVIRGSVWRLGGYLAGILVTTLSAAVLLRHLGVVDAGRYVTVVSLVAIAGGLSDLGLTAIGVREYTTRTGTASPLAPVRQTTTTGQLVGPGQRIVPDVVGLHRQQAADVLAQAQLGTHMVPTQVSDAGQVQRVVAQQPSAGQVLPAGFEVTVLIGTRRPTA